MAEASGVAVRVAICGNETQSFYSSVSSLSLPPGDSGFAICGEVPESSGSSDLPTTLTATGVSDYIRSNL